jgi:hypothetical protein
MKHTAMVQLLLLQPEPTKKTPTLPITLHTLVWCRVCRRNPGTCRKSVGGHCQGKLLLTQKFDTLAQCAEYILSRAFDCDEAIVFITSENDNQRSVADCKTEIPIGGYAVDVREWANGVGQ